MKGRTFQCIGSLTALSLFIIIILACVHCADKWKGGEKIGDRVRTLSDTQVDSHTHTHTHSPSLPLTQRCTPLAGYTGKI